MVKYFPKFFILHIFKNIKIMLAPRNHNHSTPLYAIKDAFNIIKPDKNDIIIDLGCGDCRSLIYASKTFNCKCIGYEIVNEKVENSKVL